MEYFVIRFYDNSTGSFKRLDQKKINLESRWSSILCRTRLEFTATLPRLKSCSIFLNFLKLFWILSKNLPFFEAYLQQTMFIRDFESFETMRSSIFELLKLKFYILSQNILLWIAAILYARFRFFSQAIDSRHFGSEMLNFQKKKLQKILLLVHVFRSTELGELNN